MGTGRRRRATPGAPRTLTGSPSWMTMWPFPSTGVEDWSTTWLACPRTWLLRRPDLRAGAGGTEADRRRAGTLNLSGALWITADMAYRRSVLLATGGFDERFRVLSARTPTWLCVRCAPVRRCLGRAGHDPPARLFDELAQQPPGPGGQRRQRFAPCQVRAPLAFADRNLTGGPAAT